MSGHKRIRAALVALLETVPGMGTLHNYERFASKPKDFQALYLQGQNIRGFYIRRQSYRETPYSTMKNRVRARWIIKGFASLVDADATELAFDDLLDAIAATLRATPILFDANGNALCHTVTDDSAGLQLEESGPVMFAGVLCHGATFSLTTEHLEEIEPNISDPTASPKPGQEKEGCPGYLAAIDPADVTAPAAEVKAPFATDSEGGRSRFERQGQAKSGVAGFASVPPARAEKGDVE